MDIFSTFESSLADIFSNDHSTISLDLPVDSDPLVDAERLGGGLLTTFCVIS